MRYYWPSAHRECHKITCASVKFAASRKVQQLAPAGLMGRRAITRPWSVVAGDTMGPFPRSAQGNETVIIFRDSLYKMDRSGTWYAKPTRARFANILLERVFFRDWRSG
ncbi:unnamed protein product, partial [Trichogramma brassicae]